MPASAPTTIRYLEPTEASGRAFVMRQLSGPVVMLNLLRFRAIADYSASPALAPSSPIRGADAFQRYIAHTLPFLRESGGDIAFLGEGGAWLIGPSEERWDMAMLIRHRDASTFLGFASHAAYLAGMGHRIAAIEDARLLPLSEAVSTGEQRLPPLLAEQPSTAHHGERSVRLLDRHWAWLKAQPRSASASLRAMVEEASRDAHGRYRAAQAKEACYLYMRDMAGDRPHFEEAVRALFADDRATLAQRMASWPGEVQAQIHHLLGPSWPEGRHGVVR
ncbi:DUF2239 family protein [Dyella sp. ASV21]|uniref:DUF2239 family protein n=1 Tax=Dyella sp. ASV21 TaxID=2795114 RepID=UPI0018EAD24C|nr:DUF2239 family protein [Dyella sp. ASV21]